MVYKNVPSAIQEKQKESLLKSGVNFEFLHWKDLLSISPPKIPAPTIPSILNHGPQHISTAYVDFGQPEKPPYYPQKKQRSNFPIKGIFGYDLKFVTCQKE